MNRMNKWRYKRVQMDAEKQRFQTMLLNTSEELMKVHSDMSNGILTRTASILDEQMDDPLDRLDELMGELKERKSFL